MRKADGWTEGGACRIGQSAYNVARNWHSSFSIDISQVDMLICCSRSSGQSAVVSAETVFWSPAVRLIFQSPFFDKTQAISNR
jgi:hypothetical protein